MAKAKRSPRTETAITATTSDRIEGKKIARILGVVSGEAVLGANLMQDHFVGVRDVHAGDAERFAAELNTAREIAMETLKRRAAALGANAVVGIDLDYESIRGDSPGVMLLLSANGTAVVVK